MLQRLPAEPPRGRLRCGRCGAVLHRQGHDIVQLPFALGVAAAILFLLANSFPLLEFRFQGRTTTAYLLQGVFELHQQGMSLLAVTVLASTLLAPGLQILLLLTVYGQLALGRPGRSFVPAVRLLQRITPWSMLEIFLLGIIVASVKLAEQASIVPGPAAWALAGLTLMLAAAATQVHPHRLWERVR
jgi:paraquat-inducible protein A